MTGDILRLVSWLKETDCEMAAMESTGNYRKPVYNIFEEENIPSVIVNAQHIKGVPGRKTDVKDAEWIADLVRHGLVKASYIPNRELREITRYRQEIIEERARELNRIQSVLEGCNIKLGSVVTDISGKSGMAILRAVISGETDPDILSNLAEGKARNKLPEMRRVLEGHVLEHQRKMLEHQLGLIESLTSLLTEIDEDIKKTDSIKWAIEALDAIGRRSAERILAETGVEMEHFQNESHFSSWAGLVPECKESAGKKMSTGIRKGNKYLKATPVECTRSAIRNKQSYLYSRYQRIAARREGKRALIAVAHTILVAIYHILKEKVPYCDLGADHYSNINQEKNDKKKSSFFKKVRCKCNHSAELMFLNFIMHKGISPPKGELIKDAYL